MVVLEIGQQEGQQRWLPFMKTFDLFLNLIVINLEL
jgi:hypothetical protein